MQFQYQAKTKQGQTTSGLIESTSINDARDQLRKQGLFILEITQAKENQLSQSLARSTKNKRIKKSDLLMFTTQLSIMCQSGIDLAEALHNIGSQCRNLTLKAALEKIYLDVSDGQSVSAAMGKHEKIFGNAYISSIAAGEASGTLIEILGRLSELLRNEIRLQNTLRSVLSYPLVLMSVAILVVFALIFFVLPQFAIVFRDLGKTPPPTTELILNVGWAVREYSVYLVIFGGIGFAALFQFARTKYAQVFRDRIHAKRSPFSKWYSPSPCRPHIPTTWHNASKWHSSVGSSPPVPILY